MRTLRGFHLAAACLLAAQLVASELPTFKEADLPCHRLPTIARPTKYKLHLKFPSLDSSVYQGQVDITVDFLKKSAELLAESGLENVACVSKFDENTIVLHSDKSITIEDIKVTSQPSLCPVPGCFQTQRKILEITRDTAKQMIAIKVKDGHFASLAGTRGKIKITFRGRLRGDKRGVYLSTYNDGKQIFRHIVTQFQPTFARTVFPSFDEPRFRANFSVSVTHPNELTAYGNTKVEKLTTDGDLTLTRFAITPALPVHMVAFTIGQFDKPLETSSWSFEYKKERKISVITAPGKRNTAHHASRVTTTMLEKFEKYIKYDLPLEKLDVIAIADLERDNSESWGLVFVRDTLLWDDLETKEDTRLTTSLNIAHVVVHQWFGNLISANWWSDLWITESIAAQRSIEMVLHDYEIKSFVHFTTPPNVQQIDQAGNQHPLSPSEENLRTSDQIQTIFDDLELMKSALMAKTIRDQVDKTRHPDLDYQKILQKLVKERANKTVSLKHYQSVIGELSNVDDLLDFVEKFPKYVGVPVVNCQIDTSARAVKLDLESFASARPNMDQPSHGFQQPLPIVIDANLVTPDMWKAQQSALRKQSASSSGDRGADIRELPGWFDFKDLVNPTSKNFIKMNSIGSYYRTRYSDELYDKLQEAIKKGLIQVSDSIQILEDANSFVQAGLISVERFKNLLDSFATENRYEVILSIFNAVNTYKALSPESAGSLQDNKPIWSVFNHEAFEGRHPLIAKQRAREAIFTALIQEGNEQVTLAALKAFDKAYGDVALYLRQPVYTAVVLSGSSIQKSWLTKHLWETDSYDEQIRLLTALTLSKDKELLTKVKSWLELSGLKAEIRKPFLDTISAVLSPGWTELTS